MEERVGGGETSEGGVGTGDVVRVGYFRGEGGRTVRKVRDWKVLKASTMVFCG